MKLIAARQVAFLAVVLPILLSQIGCNQATQEALCLCQPWPESPSVSSVKSVDPPQPDSEEVAELISDDASEVKSSKPPEVKSSKPPELVSNRPSAGRAASTNPDIDHEDLDATAWIQTSAEYPSIARQTYRMAAERLPDAIADATWSAIPAQANALAANPQRMPVAVILDLDETVIDNSGFQAELIQEDAEYTPERWAVWANKSMARAVPGAIEFLGACRSKGVRVFFVTNREFAVEEATRRNLIKLGILKEDDGDNILTKRERDDWGSDKSTRRNFLALDLRILMLIGDDLNDFVWAGKIPSPEQRRAQAEKYRSYFGERWFVLPNPNYGGWERSLYDFNDRLPREKKLQGKLDHLWDSK